MFHNTTLFSLPTYLSKPSFTSSLYLHFFGVLLFVELTTKSIIICLHFICRQNELYDVMLKEYKAETHRKNPLRKR